ncbi:transmembrane 9 superfamily member 9-like [Panicum miliaceum]|uniref:Transmembrane 9 superfamily member n=1 Tax=Panicum miliaceum TaxID=4540 RepID=A0A3L6PHS9_PANMI|nr:transmembrane 9 superfamily member 9-like [Panicum miliaceum]
MAMTTHLALLFLLVLACAAARGFYLPAVAPADFRKVVLPFFPPQGPVLFLFLEVLFPDALSRGCLQHDLLAVKVKQLSSIKTQVPYSYYSLPFCRPVTIVNSAGSLGERLRGDGSRTRPTWILDNLPMTIPVIGLDKEAPVFYLQGMPVGVKEWLWKDYSYFIHNHLSFLVKYNRDAHTGLARIVGFEESGIKRASRWDTHLNTPDDHWFNIGNSLMTVLFLSVMVAMIMLGTLYRDISMYNQLENQEEAQEESGWKLLHGNAFRPPVNADLLTCLSPC